jgi:hypothetical protein
MDIIYPYLTTIGAQDVRYAVAVCGVGYQLSAPIAYRHYYCVARNHSRATKTIRAIAIYPQYVRLLITVSHVNLLMAACHVGQDLCRCRGLIILYHDVIVLSMCKKAQIYNNVIVYFDNNVGMVLT